MDQQDPQVRSFEIADPSPKPQKLDHGDGGVNGVLRVKKLSEKAVLPFRANPFAAGYDLSSSTEVTVPARGKAMVPTDLSIALPEGTYGRIAPRSGLAWNHSIDVLAGVIDADLLPIRIMLFNHSDAHFEVKAGDRVAQLIIEVIKTPEVVEVEGLDSSVTCAGGFGSAGLRSS